jgi:hypothetical protein
MLASVRRFAPRCPPRHGETRSRHTPYEEGLPTRTVVVPLANGSVCPAASPVPSRRPRRPHALAVASRYAFGVMVTCFRNSAVK